VLIGLSGCALLVGGLLLLFNDGVVLAEEGGKEESGAFDDGADVFVDCEYLR
jgi:hypothetical protein